MKHENSQTPGELNELILRAQKNQEEAFEELLSRYTPLIESLTSQFAASVPFLQDREDLRQEAVLGFYKALTRFDASQQEVQFGLYAKECIRNRLISYLRSLKKHEKLCLLEDDSSEKLEDAEEDPANRLVEQESYAALYERIHQALSPYENRVWWMYTSGRTASEIAARVERDEKSVQNAIYRIRRKLRSVIPYS